MILTDNLVRWLELLLEERYSVPVTLQIREDRWVMTLPHLDGCIEVMRTGTSFSGTTKDIPCSYWNAAGSGFRSPVAERLPAPGVAVLPEPLVQSTQSGFQVNYDFFSLAAWMMTRQEEVGCAIEDAHGRFPSSQSHAAQNGYLERPLVDEWFYVLRQLVMATWPGVVLRTLDARCLVSHDVDRPSRAAFVPFPRFLGSMISDVLKRRDLRSFLNAPAARFFSRDRLHPADPVNTFSWLMSVSERHGLQSAFYFICGRTDPSKDAHYEPEHPAIRNLMREIHKRGHEIGLHPSYGTYCDASGLAAEAERLKRICSEELIEQTVWGGRMHFLRWSHPTTLRAWVKAGMDYDSTLGYADVPGFRCGTCYEYPAFDTEADMVLPIRIRPLVAMECTVMAERYMGLGPTDAAREKFISLKDTCRAVGGNFTLLWHNSSFDCKQERAVYEDVLAA